MALAETYSLRHSVSNMIMVSIIRDKIQPVNRIPLKIRIPCFLLPEYRIMGNKRSLKSTLRKDMFMKKKIGLTLLVLAAATLLIAGYFQFLAPKPQAGTKSVTVQVVIQKNNINQTFHFTSSRSTVADLLKDEQTTLKTVTESGQYGLFITGMLGVQTDPSKEYFNIKVDGKDANVGVSELPLENGKTYLFTLTSL